MQRAAPVRRAATCLAVIVALTLASACTSSDDDSPAATGGAPSTPSSSTDTGEVGWFGFGNDLANTRTNLAEVEVTSETVGALRERWSIDGIVGVTGTPTVANGVAYFGDWTGTVRAVETDTGKEQWTAELGGAVMGSAVIDGDALYAASGRTLYRIERATGALTWQVDAHDHPFAMISASPVVADGRVFIGVASGELTVPMDDYTFRGSIGAYDAATGEEIWRLLTSPDDATGGAGVGVWSTPAVDTELGLLFVGTGNAYEEPTGELADSIIAIDYSDGELVWSTQFTNPDVFSVGDPGGKDADVGAAPNLWTADGRTFVGAGDKAGVYHALDRETGDVIWETTLTPGSVFGGDIGSSAYVDGRLVVASNVGDPETNAPTNFTKVFALDATTGDVEWTSEQYEGLVFAPVSAVPGVAFVATTLNTMLALDISDGEELWRYEAANQVGCGPSIINGNVLWGYGFALFGTAGEGGLISFEVDPEA